MGNKQRRFWPTTQRQNKPPEGYTQIRSPETPNFVYFRVSIPGLLVGLLRCDSNISVVVDVTCLSYVHLAVVTAVCMGSAACSGQRAVNPDSFASPDTMLNARLAPACPLHVNRNVCCYCILLRLLPLLLLLLLFPLRLLERLRLLLQRLRLPRLCLRVKPALTVALAPTLITNTNSNKER